jgi:enoyl-CoA hydratase/carnithine racemase
MNEFADAWRRAEADDDIHVVVVTGAGQQAFCAGADLKSMPRELRELEARGEKLPPTIFKDINLSKPVIAAINGHAAGGGLELALCCDVRIAADHARLGLPESRHGLIPGGGGTQRLPRLIPAARALEMMWLGEMITAEEALRLGLVNQVVPYTELRAATERYIAVLAVRDLRVLRGIKLAWQLSQTTTLQDGLLQEQAVAESLIHGGAGGDGSGPVTRV